MTFTWLQALSGSAVIAAVIGGLFMLLGKKVWSPESKVELARLGNEFAAQMLETAKTEREELRKTITQLEQVNVSKQETIDGLNSTIEKLKNLMNEKDLRISELENMQYILARKLQRGDPISLKDVFGAHAPEEFKLSVAQDPI